MELVTPLPTGTRLSDYIIGQVLGRGGFGTTYLCEDAYLKKNFVVKEFTPHDLVTRDRSGRVSSKGLFKGSRFSKARAAFIQEAQALARFSHPNIARVVRYFEANNTAYFVMEYETGSNLRTFLTQYGKGLSDLEIEALVLPLCDGLAQLHGQGLIHRDLKPDNILIRKDGSPILIDFGAVKSHGHSTEVVFTPRYAPPEQLSDALMQGPWTDIYALGATMYEMIQGEPPPDARIRQSHPELAYVYPKAGTGRNATKILNLIEKCLSLEISERPQNTREVSNLLRNDDERLFGAILKDTSLDRKSVV